MNKLELVQKAVDDCTSLYMEGVFIIPITLEGDQLFMMSRGVREYVDINEHTFEEDV